MQVILLETKLQSLNILLNRIIANARDPTRNETKVILKTISYLIELKSNSLRMQVILLETKLQLLNPEISAQSIILSTVLSQQLKTNLRLERWGLGGVWGIR